MKRAPLQPELKGRWEGRGYRTGLLLALSLLLGETEEPGGHEGDGEADGHGDAAVDEVALAAAGEGEGREDAGSHGVQGHMGEGGIEACSRATAEGADPGALVAQEHAVEQGLTNATEELGHEVAPAQTLVLGVLHLEGHGQADGGSGEVLDGGGHEEHGVVAHVAKVGDGDAHDADVHAGEDEHGIGGREDRDGKEAERGVADDLEESGNGVAKQAAQGSQDVELERDGR